MASARRPRPPPAWLGWADHQVIMVLVRVPFTSHDTLRAVCRRTNALLRSSAFREKRRESGYAERGVVVAGGFRDGRATAECWLLVGRRWRPIAPLTSPRRLACSAVIENELWVIGGLGGDNQGRATVEIYNPQTDTWRIGLPGRRAIRTRALALVRGRRARCAFAPVRCTGCPATPPHRPRRAAPRAA